VAEDHAGPRVAVEDTRVDKAQSVGADFGAPGPRGTDELGRARENLPALPWRRAGVDVERDSKFLQRGPEL
jgi:hypothetical protein